VLSLFIYRERNRLSRKPKDTVVTNYLLDCLIPYTSLVSHVTQWLRDMQVRTSDIDMQVRTSDNDTHCRDG